VLLSCPAQVHNLRAAPRSIGDRSYSVDDAGRGWSKAHRKSALTLCRDAARAGTRGEFVIAADCNPRYGDRRALVVVGHRDGLRRTHDTAEKPRRTPEVY
jgi:hypothetical protein